MNEQTEKEVKLEPLHQNGFYSNITDGYSIIRSHPDSLQPLIESNDMQLSKSERMKLAAKELRVGQRIYDELKRQGRTVTWLAQQLSMERTSLYYTFRQNSIDLELLLRISYFLGYNFFQDLNEMYKSYGL